MLDRCDAFNCVRSQECRVCDVSDVTRGACAPSVGLLVSEDMGVICIWWFTLLCFTHQRQQLTRKDAGALSRLRSIALRSGSDLT